MNVFAKIFLFSLPQNDYHNTIIKQGSNMPFIGIYTIVLIVGYGFVCTKFCTYICEKYHTMIATSISDFRSNIKHYVDIVVENGSAVIINRGAKSAVLISQEEYNSIKETERIMLKPELENDIRAAVDAIGNCSGIEVDIDEL